jgi:hypothetical protein
MVMVVVKYRTIIEDTLQYHSMLPHPSSYDENPIHEEKKNETVDDNILSEVSRVVFANLSGSLH